MITEEDLRQGRGLLEATPLELKLWSRVRIIDDDNSCWPWGGPVGKEPNHYGKVNWRIPETGDRLYVTHRAAFYVTHGWLPEVARHTCDNPPCCRPKHIIDGTQADNIADMDARGRRVIHNQDGVKNPRSKLTEDMVRVARTLYRNGMSVETIASSMNQGVSAIRFAITGDTWGHITDVPPVTASERRSPGGKLTQAQIDEIRARRAAGESCAALGREFGVHGSNISYLTRDKTQKKPRVRVNLTDEQVREIRLLRVQEVPYQGIAERFGISRGLVNHIVNGRAYTHVK